VQAHLPLLLLLHPPVKGGFFVQPETVEEGAAHQREGVLDLGDQSSALRLSGNGGEPQDLFPGLLHDVQVQVQRSLRVQAEGILLSEQRAMRNKRGGRSCSSGPWRGCKARV
jgi:hypothetical protein